MQAAPCAPAKPACKGTWASVNECRQRPAPVVQTWMLAAYHRSCTGFSPDSAGSCRCKARTSAGLGPGTCSDHTGCNASHPITCSQVRCQPPHLFQVQHCKVREGVGHLGVVGPEVLLVDLEGTLVQGQRPVCMQGK